MNFIKIKPNLKKPVTAIFLISFFVNSISAQITNDIKSYIENSFAGNYLTSYKILQSLKISDPNNKLTNLAFANYWLSLYETTGNNEKYHTLCKTEAEKLNKPFSQQTILTPDEVYNIISAKAILLKIQVSKKQYLKAANEFKSIIKYTEYALDHEQYLKMKIISGLYNYYVETAKEDYPVIYPVLLFYPNGNKKKGLKLLTECSRSDDIFISTRSKLYLAVIYTKDEKNYIEAEKNYTELLNRYPKNVQWRKEYIDMLIAFGNIEKAKIEREKLKNVIKSSTQLTEEQRIFLSKQ